MFGIGLNTFNSLYIFEAKLKTVPGYVICCGFICCFFVGYFRLEAQESLRRRGSDRVDLELLLVLGRVTSGASVAAKCRSRLTIHCN